MSKVLITGTSAGIGLQTAIVLAKAGHRVIATMRSLERGSALREAVANHSLPISIVSNVATTFGLDVKSTRGREAVASTSTM